MGKTIKGIGEALSSKGNRFDRSIYRFPEIKIDKIAKSLKLEKRGKDDGKSGIPDTKASAMMGVELESIDEVRKLRNAGLNNFEIEMESYASRIASVNSEKQYISLMVGVATHEIFTLSKGKQNKLENRRRRVAEHQGKLKRFQKLNSIEGPPRDTGNMVLSVGLLLVIMLAEVIMNSYFFAEANPMGYLGSIMLAFVISAVNVSISGIFGFFSRAININRNLAKLRGYFLIMMFVFIAVTVNLAVAHLRDALENNLWDDSLILAISMLIENPVNLKSFSSWLVCIFGGVVSFVAFWKGFSFFDPYPNYGRLWKENEKSIDDYAVLYDDAQEELNEVFEKRAQDLRGEVEKRRSNLRSAEDAVISRSTLMRNLPVFLESCNSAANRLLRAYRDENLKAREKPAPAYFEKHYSFDDYQVPGVIDGLPGKPDNAEKEVKNIELEVKKGVEKLLKEREKAILAFPTVLQIKVDASSATSGSAAKSIESIENIRDSKKR